MTHNAHLESHAVQWLLEEIAAHIFVGHRITTPYWMEPTQEVALKTGVKFPWG